LELQNVAHTGEVETRCRERVDFAESVNVVWAVAADAARTTRRVDETFAFVQPESLRVQPSQFGGHGNAEQAASGLTPRGTHGHLRRKNRIGLASSTVTD
jgi:hypothetical protein